MAGESDITPVEDRGGSTFRRDFLASLVVFMVALPLCIAIAGACELPPEVGIISGIVGGLVVGPIAGSPLQVSGPAAGLIVLILDFVVLRNKMYQDGESAYPVLVALGMAVLLGGLMQLGMAGLKLGQWFRAVSPAVVLGMLGGIGVVIFAKQVHVMIDDVPAQSVKENILSIPLAVEKAFSGWNDEAGRNHTAAVCAGLVTMFFLIFWSSIVPKRLKLIPAALVAVVAGTLVAEGFGLTTQRIEVDRNLLKSVTWIGWESSRALIGDSTIWMMAVAIAFIASAETLLCCSAVDKMHRGPRTNYNRELMAQGVGNTLCGVLGALPMTGVIVRSSANISAGAKTRLSATLHGVWLLLFVVALPFILEKIPSACLAAVLVYTGYKLVNFKAAYRLWKESRGEAAIFVVTLLGIVFTDLLVGVIVGVILTALKLLYSISRLNIVPTIREEKKEVHLYLEGAATFLSLPKLANALEKVPRGWALHVSLDGLQFIDHTCLQLLTEWEKQHETTGGQLFLDQDGLLARFDKPRIPPVSSATLPMIDQDPPERR